MTTVRALLPQWALQSTFSHVPLLRFRSLLRRRSPPGRERRSLRHLSYLRLRLDVASSLSCPIHTQSQTQDSASSDMQTRPSQCRCADLAPTVATVAAATVMPASCCQHLTKSAFSPNHSSANAFMHLCMELYLWHNPHSCVQCA